MIVYKYTQKHYDKNGKIIGYTLQDSHGNKVNIYSDNLKEYIRNAKVNVLNLKLTTDGRLIDNKNKIEEPSNKFGIDNKVETCNLGLRPEVIKDIINKKPCFYKHDVQVPNIDNNYLEKLRQAFIEFADNADNFRGKGKSRTIVTDIKDTIVKSAFHTKHKKYSFSVGCKNKIGQSFATFFIENNMLYIVLNVDSNNNDIYEYHLSHECYYINRIVEIFMLYFDIMLFIRMDEIPIDKEDYRYTVSSKIKDNTNYKYGFDTVSCYDAPDNKVYKSDVAFFTRTLTSISLDNMILPLQNVTAEVCPDRVVIVQKEGRYITVAGHYSEAYTFDPYEDEHEIYLRELFKHGCSIPGTEFYCDGVFNITNVKIDKHGIKFNLKRTVLDEHGEKCEIEF